MIGFQRTCSDDFLVSCMIEGIVPVLYLLYKQQIKLWSQSIARSWVRIQRRHSLAAAKLF